MTKKALFSQENFIEKRRRVGGGVRVDWATLWTLLWGSFQEIVRPEIYEKLSEREKVETLLQMSNTFFIQGKIYAVKDGDLYSVTI